MKQSKLLLITTFFVSMLGLSGCNAGQSGNQAWQMINEGALLVDVRTPGEYNSGHIEGAKLIPVDQITNRLREFGADKNRPIVVYCRSGNRSGRAQGILQANGFTNVVNGGGYSSLAAAKPQ